MSDHIYRPSKHLIGTGAIPKDEAAEDVSWGSGQGQRGGKQWRGQNAPEGDPAPSVSGELPALQSWEKEKTGWGQGIRIPCGLFSSPPLPPAPADTLSCFLFWHPIRPRPDEKVTTRGTDRPVPGRSAGFRAVCWEGLGAGGEGDDRG